MKKKNNKNPQQHALTRMLSWLTNSTLPRNMLLALIVVLMIQGSMAEDTRVIPAIKESDDEDQTPIKSPFFNPHTTQNSQPLSTLNKPTPTKTSFFKPSHQASKKTNKPVLMETSFKTNPLAFLKKHIRFEASLLKHFKKINKTRRKTKAKKKLAKLLLNTIFIALNETNPLEHLMKHGLTIEIVGKHSNKVGLNAAATFLPEKNSIYLRYSRLMKDELHKSTLIHEFWHAYSFYLGKKRAKKNNPMSTLHKNLQKTLMTSPFPMASSDAGKSFAELIKAGKNRLKTYKTTEEDIFKRYQQVLSDCQPRQPEPVTVKSPPQLTGKQFSDFHTAICVEIETQGYSLIGGVYATKVVKGTDNGQLTLAIYGFHHKPSQKAKIILSQLKKARDRMEKKLSEPDSQDNRAYVNLSRELNLPYKTLIEHFALVEENAEIMSLGQPFVETFFPEMLEYHRNMDAQYFPAEDSDQLAKYRAK